MVYNIYVDGSYKNYGVGIGEFYSSAAVIMKEGFEEPETILSKVSNDELISMRNVAGELLAVMMAMEHCMNVLKLTQSDTINVYYDYAGIRNWTLKKGEPGYWKSNTETTQAYRDYMNSIVKPRLKVNFYKVKAHSGIKGNELADTIVKQVMQLHVLKLMSGEGTNE